MSEIREIIDMNGNEAVHVFDIVLTDRDDVRVGDQVLCKDGNIRTVCSKDIKWDSFMGTSIFGDTYVLGREKVKKVTNFKSYSKERWKKIKGILED